MLKSLLNRKFRRKTKFKMINKNHLSSVQNLMTISLYLYYPLLKSWKWRFWSLLIYLYSHSPRCNFSSAHRVTCNQRPASRNKSASCCADRSICLLPNLRGVCIGFFRCSFLYLSLLQTRLSCKTSSKVSIEISFLKLLQPIIFSSKLLLGSNSITSNQRFRGFWVAASYFTPPFP